MIVDEGAELFTFWILFKSWHREFLDTILLASLEVQIVVAVHGDILMVEQAERHRPAEAGIIKKSFSESSKYNAGA